MTKVDLVTELQLTHTELMIVVGSVMSTVPGTDMFNAIDAAFSAHKAWQTLTPEEHLAFIQKLHNYHEHLHLLDPTLDVHHDN